MSQNYTFTAAGSLPDRFKTSGGRSELILGKEGDIFPSSVKVQKISQTGEVITLRDFTSAPTNRGVLLETTPNSTIDITVATTSEFYVELNDLTE